MGEAATAAASPPSTAAPLSSSSLSSFQDSLASTGLLYFSRLPPHLKPAKLRQLLSSYGAVHRIFLTPERSDQTRARARAAQRRGDAAKSSFAPSSSSVRRYVDGWVEFEDKRVAKAVAVTLNGTQVGGRKRGYWYDDLWSVKYLKGFKWNHLTERAAFERQMKEGRRREEVGQARRESERYLALVAQGSQGRQIAQRREKAARKRQEAGEGEEGQGEEAELRPSSKRLQGSEGSESSRPLRTFYQRPVVVSKALDEL